MSNDHFGVPGSSSQSHVQSDNYAPTGAESRLRVASFVPTQLEPSSRCWNEVNSFQDFQIKTPVSIVVPTLEYFKSQEYTLTNDFTRIDRTNGSKYFDTTFEVEMHIWKDDNDDEISIKYLFNINSDEYEKGYFSLWREEGCIKLPLDHTEKMIMLKLYKKAFPKDGPIPNVEETLNETFTTNVAHIDNFRHVKAVDECWEEFTSHPSNDPNVTPYNREFSYSGFFPSFDEILNESLLPKDSVAERPIR